MNAFEAARGDITFQVNSGRAIEELGAVGEQYARTTGAMSDDALRLAVAQERLNKTIARSGPESTAAKNATIAYRRELAALTEQANAAATADARRQAAALRAASAAAEAQTANTLAAARTIGHTLTSYITTPVALLGGVATKMAIDFNQQMLLIQTQAGATAAEVRNLTGAVLDLAKTAPQSPTELAQGLYHLESLGLRGAKAIDTLKISSIAAGQGIANLEDVATALGGVVVTGIKGAQNYQKALDALVATVGVGNTRFEDLAGAVGNVTPAAAAAGVTLPEMGAALAVLTDRGFSAEEAATRLRAAFALIQAPSGKATKALKDMGITANELGGMLRQPDGLTKVLQLLHDSIDKVGAVRGNRDLLQAFGGSRQGLGIQTLVQSLNSDLSSYQGKLRDIGEQEKQASRNRQAYLASDAYKVHAAISTIEADMIKLGGATAPVFVAIAQGIGMVADGFEKLPKATKIYLGVIVGLLAVGGPVVLAITSTIRAVELIGKAFKKVPVAAGESVAATEAELAGLRTAAAETGAAVGGELATGVGTGVAAAGARIAALRLSLLGLGAISIAPIVIPIVYDVVKSVTQKILGTEQPLPGETQIGTFQTPTGRGVSVVGNGKIILPGHYRAIEPTAAAAKELGMTLSQLQAKVDQTLSQNQPITGIPGSHQPVRGVDTPNRFAPDTPTTATTARQVQPGPGRLQRINLAISSAQTAYARGDKGSADAIVTALRAEVDYDRHYEQIQEDLLRRHVGDANKHATILNQLRGDEQSALNQIQSIEDARAQALSDAADKRKQAAEQRAQDAAQAYRDELSIRQKELEIARARAQLTEGTTADDRKSLAAEIAFDKARVHDLKLTKSERLDYLSQELALRKELEDMDKQAGQSLTKQVEADVLSQIASILSKFGPNAYPEPGKSSSKTDTHLYDIKHELRRQTPLLRAGLDRNLFPASDYAVNAAGSVAG